MDEPLATRTATTVRRLRQSSIAFRWLSIASGIGALVAAVGSGLAEPDVGASGGGAVYVTLFVYAIVGAIGCYAVHAALDGLAAMVELLAAKAG